MKKLLLLFILCFAAPAALGDNGGARSIAPPPEISRLPHADGGGGLIELRANNIQVQAEWSINPDAPFLMDNGKLHYIDGMIVPPATVTVMVTVEDNFKLLNPSYANLTAEAAITIAFLPSQSTIYVMGGLSSTVYYQDVWYSSDDGQSWSEETADVGWSVRDRFQAVVHNGTIYVLMGQQGGDNDSLNDVWSSLDGKTWALLGNANWIARNEYQAVVHHGVIYVLGGNRATHPRNDVWSSVDGINWSAIQLNANWPTREKHQAVSHNGRLYVLGGFNRNTLLTDVWSSADGINWVQETANAEWGLRESLRTASHNGKIYVLGGNFLGTSLKDVWSSADGKVWVQETADAQWGGRSSLQAFSHNGLMYILGGDDNGALNDVWSSREGQNWTLVKDSAAWPPRSSFQTVILP